MTETDSKSVRRKRAEELINRRGAFVLIRGELRLALTSLKNAAVGMLGHQDLKPMIERIDNHCLGITVDIEHLARAITEIDAELKKLGNRDLK